MGSCVSQCTSRAFNQHIPGQRPCWTRLCNIQIAQPIARGRRIHEEGTTFEAHTAYRPCADDTTLGWFLGTGDDTRTAEEVGSQQACALEHTGGSPETLPRDMIRLAFSSKSTLAVAPMQDYLGLGSEARLNVPGTTLNNWRWRMLSSQIQPALLESVRTLVQECDRGN